MDVEVEKVKRNSGYRYSYGAFYITLYNDKDGNSAADRLTEKLNNRSLSDKQKAERKVVFVQEKLRQYKVLTSADEWASAVKELTKAIFGGI